MLFIWMGLPLASKSNVKTAVNLDSCQTFETGITEHQCTSSLAGGCWAYTLTNDPTDKNNNASHPQYLIPGFS